MTRAQKAFDRAQAALLALVLAKGRAAAIELLAQYGARRLVDVRPSSLVAFTWRARLQRWLP